jgi:hypothetical protein
MERRAPRRHPKGDAVCRGGTVNGFPSTWKRVAPIGGEGLVDDFPTSAGADGAVICVGRRSHQLCDDARAGQGVRAIMTEWVERRSRGVRLAGGAVERASAPITKRRPTVARYQALRLVQKGEGSLDVESHLLMNFISCSLNYSRMVRYITVTFMHAFGTCRSSSSARHAHALNQWESQGDGRVECSERS